MDKKIIQPNVKRGRGRPPLPVDEKEHNIKESKRKYNEANKENISKYSKEHRKKAKEQYQVLGVKILKSVRPELDKILHSTNSNITDFFTSAVEKVYGLKLTED